MREPISIQRQASPHRCTPGKAVAADVRKRPTGPHPRCLTGECVTLLSTSFDSPSPTLPLSEAEWKRQVQREPLIRAALRFPNAFHIWDISLSAPACPCGCAVTGARPAARPPRAPPAEAIPSDTRLGARLRLPRAPRGSPPQKGTSSPVGSSLSASTERCHADESVRQRRRNSPRSSSVGSDGMVCASAAAAVLMQAIL